MRTVIVAAGLLSLGYWLAPGAPAASPQPRSQAAPPRNGASHIDLDVAALRAELRAAARHEPSQPQHGADDRLADPQDLPAAPSAEQRLAASRARRAIDEVIARGRLTVDDARELRPVLAAMDPDDALALRLALAQAINADLLAIDRPDTFP